MLRSQPLLVYSTVPRKVTWRLRTPHVERHHHGATRSKILLIPEWNLKECTDVYLMLQSSPALKRLVMS